MDVVTTPTPRPIMRTSLADASLALVLLAFPPLAPAHEFWIAPRDSTPEPGEPLVAELANGEFFAGRFLPYDASHHPLTMLATPDGVRTWEGVDGERPAVRETTSTAGLHVLALESNAGSAVHADFDEFSAFVTEEGAPDVAGRHRAEGLPETRIVELFTRHAKALVAVGGEGGADRPLGLELEIVALDDPYANGAEETLAFRLLLDGEGVADTQVSLFHKVDGAEAAAERVTTRTDASGRFAVDAAPPGRYLLNAVLLRRPSPSRMLESGALWESLWASLTFAR